MIGREMNAWSRWTIVTISAAGGFMTGAFLLAAPASAVDCKPMLPSSAQQSIAQLLPAYRGLAYDAVSHLARGRASELAWRNWSALATLLYGRTYAFDGNARDRRTDCQKIPNVVTDARSARAQRWFCRVRGKPCNG